MKKVYISPATDIIKLRLHPMMNVSLTGGGNGTGKEAQSRNYDNDLWEDED